MPEQALTPLRLLILGGGAVVSDLYLPALARMGWTSGIEVTDLSLAALAQVQALHPWVQTRAVGFGDALADAALKDHFDAVVVALPNSLHLPAVKAALQAGLPVLCEKPLTMRRADCDALAALAEAAKLPLVVGMVRRLAQSARTVRSALQQDLIGALKEVRVEHGGPYAWTSASGAFFRRENGGILADLGVHHLDWLGSVLGELTPVSYEDDARGGVEATCRYALKSVTGVNVRLHLTHLHPLPNTTTFVGDKGTLVMGKNDFACCEWRGAEGALRGELRSERAFDDAKWPADFLSCFAQQFNNFAHVVRGQAAECVGAREAGVTMGLIEHAYATRDESPRDSSVSEGPSLPPGRAVVTGGTGFIGTALVERLTQLGFKDVVVPVRGYQTCAAVARFPVQLPHTDLNDREAVRELVKGARWVFHCALGATERDAKRITEAGTQLLLEEAEAAGVEAVVVLSTAWVWARSNGRSKITEDQDMRPAQGHYGQTKANMQRACLAWAAKAEKTRVVVLNPSCVYGPEGKTYSRLPAELSKSGGFAWVEDGVGSANYVFIDNLIDAMLITANHRDAHGKAFLTTDGHCSWREFLQPLLPESDEPYPSYTALEFKEMERACDTHISEVVRSLLSSPVLRKWVRENWLMRRVRHRLPLQWTKPPQAAASPASREDAKPMPVPWLAALFGPNEVRYSNARLRSLGWEPRVDLKTGMMKTVQWLTDTHRL